MGPSMGRGFDMTSLVLSDSGLIVLARWNMSSTVLFRFAWTTGFASYKLSHFIFEEGAKKSANFCCCLECWLLSSAHDPGILAGWNPSKVNPIKLQLFTELMVSRQSLTIVFEPFFSICLISSSSSCDVSFCLSCTYCTKGLGLGILIIRLADLPDSEKDRANLHGTRANIIASAWALSKSSRQRTWSHDRKSLVLLVSVKRFALRRDFGAIFASTTLISMPAATF
mmetsp:Transcript_2288/g.4427  ORF Transcript_2288/g.4427 Transcript_2288/m.4427 type:complete len:226 (+) Transcript_2288:2970-3647(+)